MKLTEEELELFELAFLLKMPLYKLMEEMPYEELQGWFAYFKIRPYGWREDYRTSLTVTAAGATIKGADLFPSLRIIENGTKGESPLASLKTSMFGVMIEKAIGGDKIEF